MTHLVLQAIETTKWFFPSFLLFFWYETEQNKKENKTLNSDM